MEVKDVLPDLELRVLPVRSSSMADGELCPRKLLFGSRLGLAPKGGTTAIAPWRGKLFHQAVEMILKGHDTAHIRTHLTLMSEQRERDMIASVDSSGYLANGKTVQEMSKKITEENHVAMAMALAYAKFFDVVPGKIGHMCLLPGQTDQAVERLESVDTPDGPQTVKVDALVISPDADSLFVVDHKTCGRDAVVYSKTLPNSPQTLLYYSVLRRIARGLGLRPGGIIYNIIQTPTIRCSRADDYDPVKYAERVANKWYPENHKNVLVRSSIVPSAELLEQFDVRARKSAHLHTSDQLEDFTAHGGAACTVYGTPCPFLSLCNSDRATWPGTIKDKFEQKWRDDEDDDAAGD